MWVMFTPTDADVGKSALLPTGTGSLSNLNPTVGTSPNLHLGGITPLQKTLAAVLGATLIGGTTPREVTRIHGVGGPGTAPVLAAIPLQETRRQAAKTTSSILSEIKGIFGFSVTQLASVLQVTRQIVYKWLDERNTHVLQAKNRERLTQMSVFASEWTVLSRNSMGKLAETVHLDGSKSIIDLLSVDAIDEPQVREAMRQLATHINTLNTGRARRSGDKNVVPEALTVYSRTVGTDREQDT